MSDSDLKKMGKWMADALGETPRDEVIDQRQAFLEEVTSRRGAGRPVAIGMLASAAVLLLGVSVYTLFIDQVAGSAPRTVASAVEGHQVVPAGEGGETIRFDGGSEFAVAAGSSARVIRSDQNEVVIGLSEGTVDCRVNGNGHTRWMVRAGGYQVLVTGTRFSVQYEPDALFLAVDVTEGSVQVTGDALNTDGIRLAVGESIQVEDGQVAITRNETEGHKKARRARVGRHGKRHRATQALETPVVVAPEDEVERTYEELWGESRSARHQGRSEEAYAILEELRTRFPGKPYARQATFLLGRISLESRRNPAQAKRWFESYLKGSPSGALAEESIGRLISICQGMKHSCAKSYAGRYLERYPNGPFAELAQSVLE